MLVRLLLLVCFSAATHTYADDTASTGDQSSQAAGSNRFDILEFVLVGNTRLPSDAIERAVYPFMGPDKSIEAVLKAAEALGQAYRDAGFPTALVSVPEQDVDNGVVRLVVTEGKVDRLKISGSRYYSPGRIRTAAGSVREGEVPSFPKFQEELAELNRSPGRRVTPVLRQGATPGTVEVDLRVEDRLPVSGSLEWNDRHGSFTSSTRLFGNLRYENLWQRGHQISLDVVAAPENSDDALAVSVGYLAPWSGSKNLLALYAVRSRSDVALFGDLRVIGNGDVFGLRVIRPLDAHATLTQNMSFGLDYKRSIERVENGVGRSETPISYTPLTTQYTANYKSERAVTQVTVGATIGLRGLLGNSEVEFSRKRSQASASFYTFRLGLEHAVKVGNHLSLAAAFDGQLASGPLLSTEQAGIGGLDSVRGYHESEFAGDDSLRAGLELRADLLGWLKTQALRELQGIVFVDAAQATVQKALPEVIDREELVGAGFGLRASATRYLSLSVVAAHALTAAGSTRNNSWRAHFSIKAEF